MNRQNLLGVFSLIGSLLFVSSAWSIPNTFFGNGNFIGPVIPATPVFRAELTEEFFEEDHWANGTFPGPWQKDASLDGELVRRMSANPTLFGAVPMSVYAYANSSGETREIAIHFLDAGLYFGYHYRGEQTKEQRMAGSEKRREFAKHYRTLSTILRKRLDEGCGRGRQGVIGCSDELRTVYTEYQWENFLIRLVNQEDHSVSLYISPKSKARKKYIDSEIAQLDRRERQELFSANVSTTEFGDQVINGVPMFTQGNTPFCGVHSLAMAGHYLGLRIPPQTLATGAGFKNTGSAKGSDILDLYRGVGDEIDMKVRIAPKFDEKRLRRSIEEGIPVVVWRRVSQQREQAHNEFRKAYRHDPSITLPEPSHRERESYPLRDVKGSPSHASVITGINVERNEVIFTEPWGEFARNRKMRFEEMAATGYAFFYFSL